MKEKGRFSCDFLQGVAILQSRSLQNSSFKFEI
jgi:hypothetical protein